MEELEVIRKKIKNRYIIGMGLTLLISIILALCFHFIFFFVALVIGLMITIIVTSHLNSDYKRIFKNTFVLKALKSIFTDLTYRPDYGIPYQVIAATKMMYMGDRYHSEDYISGKYKDIKFEQSDVHIEEEHESTDSDGNTTTTYQTIFKGRWMIFDFNKNFKSNVQISQKGFGNSKVQTFFGKHEEVYKKVSMESESFNKRFNVYAQSEHEAFYIITPSLMEKIERLDDNNKGKILLCFIDNRLHVGLYDGKDSFEPGSIFKKLNEDEIITSISSDIKMITQFVDELNLDNDLFKKEV